MEDEVQVSYSWLSDIAYLLWYAEWHGQRLAWAILLAAGAIIAYVLFEYLFERARHWWKWGRHPKGRGQIMSLRSEHVRRKIADGYTDMLEDLYFRQEITAEERQRWYYRAGIRLNLNDLLPKVPAPAKRNPPWRSPKRKMSNEQKAKIKSFEKGKVPGPTHEIPGPKPGDKVELPKVEASAVDEMLAA